MLSRKWSDRDGDGIPDEYDREPDNPAKNDYERHLQDKRRDWLGPNAQQCPFCDQAFSTKNELDRHIKKKHSVI